MVCPCGATLANSGNLHQPRLGMSHWGSSITFTFTMFKTDLAGTWRFIKSPVCIVALALTALTVTAQHAQAWVQESFGAAVKVAQNAIGEVRSASPASTTGEAGQVEIGFSPNGAALGLVIKTIRSAHKSIDLMAYSFTSADVTKELLAARKRGVAIRVVADYKQSIESSSSRYSISALSSLVTSGAQVRLTSEFSAMHDKVIIADGMHVQTGSFNYSKAAATSNSENVIVLWNAPQVANAYSKHFQSRWGNASPFRGR